MIKIKPRKLDCPSNVILFLPILLMLFNACQSHIKKTKNEIFSFNGDFYGIKEKKTSEFTGYYLMNMDTLFYNIGFNIHSLNEELPSVIYIPDRKNFKFDPNVDSSGKIFVDRKDFDVDKYRKQNIYFEHLEKGSIKKFTFPVDTIKGGIVGIYIDSLDYGPYGVLQFNLYVANPSFGSYSKFMNLIKTVKLNPIKSYQTYIRTKYIY